MLLPPFIRINHYVQTCNCSQLSEECPDDAILVNGPCESDCQLIIHCTEAAVDGALFRRIQYHFHPFYMRRHGFRQFCIAEIGQRHRLRPLAELVESDAHHRVFQENGNDS